MQHLTRRGISAWAAALVVGLGMTVVAATPSSTASWGQSRSECALRSGVNVVECGLVGATYSERGMSVQIPGPGHGVTQRAAFTDREEFLDANVDRAGVLTLRTKDGATTTRQALSSGFMSATASPNGCADTAYALTGTHVPNRTLKWYVKSGSIPSGIGVSNFVHWASVAGNTWEKGIAPCNGWQSDQVGLAVTYKGHTTHALDIHDGGTCDLFVDHQNTFGFQRLTTDAIAVTCTTRSSWGGGRTVVDTDVVVNKRFSFYLPGASCGYTRYDLLSVLMHELGHSLGLADVSPKTHYNLTMGGRARVCDTRKRTLGAGDVRGIRAIY